MEGLYLEIAGKTSETVLRTTDVEEVVNNLETVTHNYVERCIPFRTVHMSLRDLAWMTPLAKLMGAKSRIGPNNVDRLHVINRKISELIREWWKHVNGLSQCCFSSALEGYIGQAITG